MVLLFDGAEGVIQACTDIVVKLVPDVGPAGYLGHEEGLAVVGGPLGALLGLILWESAPQGAGDDLGAALLEDIRATLEEEHPEDVLLEFRCVHFAAQDV